MQRLAKWRPAGGTLWPCTTPRLAFRWRCRPLNRPGERTRVRPPGHVSWSSRTEWRGGVKRRVPVAPDTGPRSIERQKGSRDPLRHREALEAHPIEVVGITARKSSFMQLRNRGQERNTGKAHTGCVCLLRAPNKEGITSRCAQPSRLGNVGRTCAVPGVADLSPHAGVSYGTPGCGHRRGLHDFCEHDFCTTALTAFLQDDPAGRFLHADSAALARRRLT